MWRSGIAVLLTLCMVAGFVPAAVFATADEINYVSLGDSMTNGYCFTGYQQGDITASQFFAGEGVYGDDAYPNQFAAWLEAETGKTVNHTKLAVSAMRAEDLNYLLGGREKPTDDWFSQVNHYAGVDDDAELSAFFQEKIADADVITMSVGNAAFGAYLVQYVTRALGVMGGSLDADEKVNLEKAIAELDDDQKELVMQIYELAIARLKENVSAEIAEQYNMDDVCDVIAYVSAGYVLNLKGVMEQIIALNPDVQIVLVGLMNTTYGMQITGEDGFVLEIGDMMDTSFGLMNAYMAGLPATMQALGKWSEAEFYYAAQPKPEFIVQVFDDLYELGWPADYYGLSGETVRKRTIKAYNDALRPMIGMALGFNLPSVTIDDVANYNFDANDQYMVTVEFAAQAAQYAQTGNPAGLPLVQKYLNATGDYYLAQAASKAGTVFSAEIEMEISIAIYLALEESQAKSVDTMEITLEGLMGIAGDIMGALGEMPAGLNPANNPGPNTIKTELVNWFTGSATNIAMCKIFALFKVGDGMSVHPTPAAHTNIAQAVIAAYGNYTVKDESIKNAQIAWDVLSEMIKLYGPEVAAEIWAQWEEYGYIADVTATIDALKNTVAVRYDYYTTEALPAVEKAIADLAAQKDVLTAELAELTAALEAKKAELEKVISEQEIGSVQTPDINIDVELGNNTQTQVPGHDCVVEGEGIEAELNAAIKDLEHAIATVKALIADVEADIADMVALGQQIAEAVAELQKTGEDIAAAADDLKAAVEAVAAVVTDGAEENDQKFLNAFKAGCDAIAAAAKVLELTVGTGEELVADIDAMIDMVVADAEALYNKFINDLPGCVDQVPVEVKLLIAGAILAAKDALEQDQDELEAKLEEQLAALDKEYEVDCAPIKAELAALKAEIQKVADEKYAQYAAVIIAEYEAKKVVADAKLAELNAELKVYYAEQAALAADASAEAKAFVQAKIDRVLGDIKTVSDDLACAYAHMEIALTAAYEQASAEAAAEVAVAVEALNKKLAELKAEYDKAVAELKAEYAAVAALLEAEYNKVVAELQAAAEAEIEKLTAAFNAQVAAIEAAYEKALADLKAAAEAEIEKLTTDFDAEVAALNEKLNALKADCDKSVAELEAAAEAEIAKLTAAYNAGVKALNDKIAELKAEYEKAIAAAEAEVEKLTAAYNAQVAALNKKIAELKAEYDKAVAEIEAAAAAAIANAVAEYYGYVDVVNNEIAALTAEYEKAVADINAYTDAQIKKLNDEYSKLIAAAKELLDFDLDLGIELVFDFSNIDAEIYAGLEIALNIVKDAIKGNLIAVEDMTNAMIALGYESAVAQVESIVDAVNAMIKSATSAELELHDGFKYVAIGDGTAAANSYAEKLAAALNIEAAIRGFDAIELNNTAVAGNTVADALANISAVKDADLVTIGFSNITFIGETVDNILSGAELDWAAIVGAENVVYVEQMFAKIADELAANGVAGEAAVMANAAIEAYAYSVVKYAVELPILINEIKAVNPDAVVVIVGTYNPLKDVVINIDENTKMDIGEYIDYLVLGVGVHGFTYAALTGNAIYVDAPDVDTVNTKNELNLMDMIMMLYNNFEELYPSDNGDEYIKDQILNSLEITGDPIGILGDANGDGKVLANDAMLVLQYSVGDITADELNLAVCDVNGDGKVLANDAMLILQYSVGDLAKFPAQQ